VIFNVPEVIVSNPYILQDSFNIFLQVHVVKFIQLYSACEIMVNFFAMKSIT